MTDPRAALAEMEKTLSRRAFFMKVGKGLGAVAAYDRFGPRLFGTTPATDAANYQQALKIFSVFAQLIIPVDDDPGNGLAAAGPLDAPLLRVDGEALGLDDVADARQERCDLRALLLRS